MNRNLESKFGIEILESKFGIEIWHRFGSNQDSKRQLEKQNFETFQDSKSEFNLEHYWPLKFGIQISIPKSGFGISIQNF